MNFSVDDALECYRSYLENSGRELGPDREAVLQQALAIHNHFTAEDILNKLKNEMPGIMPEFVRLALGEMVRAGLIRKVFFGDAPVAFEHVFGHLHHDHLLCVRCGKLVEFSSELIENEQRRIADENGFVILRHSLQIMGLCEQCRAKPVNERPEFTAQQRVHPGDIIPLTLLPEDRSSEVIRIEGGRGVTERLAGMGIVAGDDIEVMQNTFSGPFVIKVKGASIALGRGMVERIFVRAPDNSGKRR